jgi:hypothetical protein
VPDATLGAAGARLVVADFIVLMTVRFVAGVGFAAAAAAFVVFLITVPVLASLDSLVWLTFLRPRVVAVVDVEDTDSEAPAGFLPRVVPETGVGVGPFRDVAVAPRLALAFSTMLDNRFEDLEPGPLMGDAGRPIMDLEGDGGRSWPRGTTRALVEAGDRIWPGCSRTDSAAVWSFFLGLPIGSTEFSLSSVSVMASLEQHLGQQEDSRNKSECPDELRNPFPSYLKRLWPRWEPAAVTGFRGMGLSGMPSLAGTGGGLATYGERGGLDCWFSECLARRSPIFSLRSAVGMRLTRISTRDRSCCAWT